MDPNKGLEDKLREAACFGDEDAVYKLIELGVNVNSQHEINGWTALHWASKRGHTKIVSCLLSKGADKMMLTKKGETAAMLTDNEDIAKLFGKIRSNSSDTTVMNVIKEEKLPIIPNYITFPPLHYKVDMDGSENNERNAIISSNAHSRSQMNGINSTQSPVLKNSVAAHGHIDELVLKVRVACTSDPDFIEVELPVGDLTYPRLLRVCCQELGVDPTQVMKLRKLPDTILRKDKDVSRLRDFQELELVLINHQKAETGSVDSRFSISPFPQTQLSRSHSFNHCKIFY